MSLLKNLTEKLWYKLFKIIKVIIKNCKLELLLIGILILSLTLGLNQNDFQTFVLQCNKMALVYLTEFRLSLIVSVFSIFIGSYISVWSILSTSASKMNKRILSDGLDEQILLVVFIDIIITLTCVIMVTFANYNTNLNPLIILLLVLASLLAFIKFIFHINKLTKLSIKCIIKELNDNEKAINDLNLKIEQIIDKLN